MNGRNAVWALGVVTLLGCSCTRNESIDTLPDAQANKERSLAVRRWLSANAIPLRTVEPGTALADIRLLRRLIGESRLVMVGHATPGAYEFQRFEHRLFDYLVSELGFTAFVAEVPMLEALEVDRFVTTSEGDPHELLRNLNTWHMRTQEALALLHWMRRYNEEPSHTRKLRFYGVDMSAPLRAAQMAVNYARQVDPASEPSAAKLAVMTNPYFAENHRHASEEEREKVNSAVEELSQRMDQRKTDYVARSTLSDWRLARQCLTLLRQNLDNHREDWRDYPRHIAGNLQWLLEEEGPRGKLLYIGDNRSLAVDSTARVKSTGTYIREALGGQAIGLGLFFYQGRVRANSEEGVREFDLAPTEINSLETTLAEAGLRIAALDLRAVPKAGLVGDWFAESHSRRSIGSYFDPSPKNGLEPFVDQAYQGILFIQRTHPARPIDARSFERIREYEVAENMSFEEGTAGQVPARWHVPRRGVGYKVEVTREDSRGGDQSVVIRRLPRAEGGSFYGSLLENIGGVVYRNRRLTLRFAARLEHKGAGGEAYAYLRASGDGRSMRRPVFAGMMDRPITSPDWQDYAVGIDVPDYAVRLELGLVFTGEGRAFFDAVRLDASPALLKAIDKQPDWRKPPVNPDWMLPQAK